MKGRFTDAGTQTYRTFWDTAQLEEAFRRRCERNQFESQQHIARRRQIEARYEAEIRAKDRQLQR